MVRSLRETVQASRDQDWLKTNLASIGSMMQGHRDLEVVAELIMEELAPLLGAQHGTFFLTEESGGETQAAADRRLRAAGRQGRADPVPDRAVADRPGGQDQAADRGRRDPARLHQDLLRARRGGAGQPRGHAHPVRGPGASAWSNSPRSASSRRSRSTSSSSSPRRSGSASTRSSPTRGPTRCSRQSQRLTAELQARSSELQARSEELQLSNADLEDKAALLAAQKQDIEAKNAEIERAQGGDRGARQAARASRPSTSRSSSRTCRTSCGRR